MKKRREKKIKVKRGYEKQEIGKKRMEKKGRKREKEKSREKNQGQLRKTRVKKTRKENAFLTDKR